jgi:hypothetical protein
MAKRSAQRKGVVKYLFFAVATLLIIVSLLSLFIFKYTNLISDNVLGANIGPIVTPMSINLTCESCSRTMKGSVAIILQQNGTRSATWGAMCATQQMLNTTKFVYKIGCPVATPTPVPVKNNCSYGCAYNTKCATANVVPSNCSSIYPNTVCCKSLINPNPITPKPVVSTAPQLPKCPYNCVAGYACVAAKNFQPVPGFSCGSTSAAYNIICCRNITPVKPIVTELPHATTPK